MAGSINKVILVGNVGQDPQVRTMQSGQKVVSFSLATSDRWRDRQTGEQKEQTEWHRVVIFNPNLVEVAERMLQKGTKLYLSGSIQTRRWVDAQGVDKHATEIVLQGFTAELQILDPRTKSSNGSDNFDEEYYNSIDKDNSSESNNFIEEVINDDIPF